MAYMDNGHYHMFCITLNLCSQYRMSRQTRCVVVGILRKYLSCVAREHLYILEIERGYCLHEMGVNREDLKYWKDKYRRGMSPILSANKRVDNKPSIREAFTCTRIYLRSMIDDCYKEQANAITILRNNQTDRMCSCPA